jgi:hypothetical protein
MAVEKTLRLESTKHLAPAPKTCAINPAYEIQPVTNNSCRARGTIDNDGE